MVAALVLAVEAGAATLEAARVTRDREDDALVAVVAVGVAVAAIRPFVMAAEDNATEDVDSSSALEIVALAHVPMAEQDARRRHLCRVAHRRRLCSVARLRPLFHAAHRRQAHATDALVLDHAATVHGAIMGPCVLHRAVGCVAVVAFRIAGTSTSGTMAVVLVPPGA